MTLRLSVLAVVLVVVGLGSDPALAGGYGHSYGHRHHGYHGHGRSHYGFRAHGDGYLALGLIAGTVLGYAIANTARHSHYRHYQYRDNYYYRDHYYRDYYYPREYIYYRSAPARVVYVQPPPAPAPAGRSCLQEREYQTVITIDGQPVPAWGTACLQPDGTWSRGGLNIAPR